VTSRAATAGLLLPGSPSMGGLPGGWLTTGCTPTAPPSSCGAGQGSGWGGKCGGVVRRRRGARLGFAGEFDGIDDRRGYFL
jgi:hypothetical protein